MRHVFFWSFIIFNKEMGWRRVATKFDASTMKTMAYSGNVQLAKISKLVIPKRRCRSTTMFCAQSWQLIRVTVPTGRLWTCITTNGFW